MGLDRLLQQVKDTILDHNNQQGGQGDTGGLLGQIENIFGQHQVNYGNGGSNPQVLPASQDPQGDPANQQGGNYVPNGRFGNVRPASEDPLGDPADIGTNR